jgi:hypothetical protein
VWWPRSANGFSSPSSVVASDHPGFRNRHQRILKHPAPRPPDWRAADGLDTLYRTAQKDSQPDRPYRCCFERVSPEISAVLQVTLQSSSAVFHSHCPYPGSAASQSPQNPASVRATYHHVTTHPSSAIVSVVMWSIGSEVGSYTRSEACLVLPQWQGTRVSPWLVIEIQGSVHPGKRFFLTPLKVPFLQ